MIAQARTNALAELLISGHKSFMIHLLIELSLLLQRMMLIRRLRLPEVPSVCWLVSGNHHSTILIMVIIFILNKEEGNHCEEDQQYPVVHQRPGIIWPVVA